ncbi:hypothetical protein INT45_013669 [Circinella minor]|uniref:RNA polymerase II degradation factor 1 n=1 Tax=Circinella minor TaxID=1195481 RepID=A0A8H7SBN6_9FUNG|nr:hypothetical protein INT45_013669 [Circinella minor]
MTLHETRSNPSNLTRTTGTNNNRGSLSSGNGQNNLKKLKSKYASKISTLKELFEDWSDEDLLFALQDADGDMELTIERISAGHAVQWGEVKTKKTKKEAAKAKAVAAASHSTTTTASSSSSSTSYLQRTIDRTQQQIPHNNNERGRGSRGGSTLTSTIPTTNRSSNTVRGKSTTSPTAVGTTSLLSQQQQPVQSQATSWGKQTKPIQSSERASAGGSWASVASAPKPPDAVTDEPFSETTTNNNDSWEMTAESWPAASSSDSDNNNNSNNNNNSWSANKVSSWDDSQEPENHNTSHYVEQKPPISAENPSSATASSAVPPAKTWASLLKSKPVPESETKSTTQQEEAKERMTESNWDVLAEHHSNVSLSEQATDDRDDNKDLSDPWTSTTETEQQQTSFGSSLFNEEKEDTLHETAPPSSPPHNNKGPESVDESTAEIETLSNDKKQEQHVLSPSPELIPSHSVETDTNKVKQSMGGRRLRQEEPVVLPNNASLTGVDVKFGSLNLDETLDPALNTTNARLNEHDEQNQGHQIPDEKIHPVESQQNYLNRYTTKPPAATATAASIGQSTTLPTSEVLTDTSSYLKQQQQLQQAPTGGMDHLTSAYSSYMPNQHVTSVPGYGGVNPMGSMAGYSGYGTEAQRASMGYYDPNSLDHYSSSVSSGNAYQIRDKYNQEATNTTSIQSNPAHQSQQSMSQAQQQQQQQQQHHQMYPNMNPYYQYYYMPSHFNTYQQSGYGQPFLNKNMYQQMYQTSGPKTNNPSASTQQYASQQQQVQQHLYNQALSGAAGTGSASGYDDISSSQHQFAATGGNMGGLHDYQKPSTYGSAGGSQIPGFFGGHMSSSSVAQQQAQQGPAGVQQGQGKVDSNSGHYKPNSSQQSGIPNPSNYFNQQQMASYSQHSQQFQMSQHIDNSQQLSQRHQQQYWTQ